MSVIREDGWLKARTAGASLITHRKKGREYIIATKHNVHFSQHHSLLPLIVGDFMNVFDLRRVVCRQDIAKTRNDNYQAVIVEETNT